jgi:hypothetical protein
LASWNRRGNLVVAICRHPPVVAPLAFRMPIAPKSTMADEKSMMVYARSTESQDKFDYFMATITGAILTYILQKYQPAKWCWNAATLEPIGLILLFLSFFFGLLRIQATMLVYRHNCDCLRAGEMKGSLIDAYESGTIASGIEPSSGRIITRAEMPNIINEYQEREKSEDEARKKHSNSAHTYFVWRNRLLVIGFLILLMAKMLSPYFA